MHPDGSPNEIPPSPTGWWSENWLMGCPGAQAWALATCVSLAPRLRRSPAASSSRANIQSSSRAILAETTRLWVGSHSAPMLRVLCKDLGSVNSGGAKNMTRVDRHSMCVGVAEVGMESKLPPPKRGRLSSPCAESSQSSSSSCGNQACHPSSSQKEWSVELGQVALHCSRWSFGRSPLEFSALFFKITGTSQPAGLGLGFWLYKGNPRLMIRYLPCLSFGSVSDPACKRWWKNYMKDLDCTSTVSVDPRATGPDWPFIFILGWDCFSVLQESWRLGTVWLPGQDASPEQRTHPLPLAKIHSLIFLQVREYVCVGRPGSPGDPGEDDTCTSVFQARFQIWKPE